jgi:hypothetical protein
VARVLRAAPQLKKFLSMHNAPHAASWLAPTAPTHPAFEGLTHARLREFGIRTPRAGASQEASADAEWTAHLRRRHFPRLRELSLGHAVCFVTPLDFAPGNTSNIS